MLLPNELIALGPEAQEFVEILIASFRKDEDGRVRVTKAEAKRIADAALALAGHILRDVLD